MNTNDSPRDEGSDEGVPPPHDELDRLLRDWHAENAAAALRHRASILSRPATPPVLARIRGWIGSPLTRAAAAIVLAATIVTLTLTPAREAQAGVLMVPKGGELVAFAPDGDRIGSCPLLHTDIDAEIAGPALRVRLRQEYENRFQQRIEAVYTFPLPDRAAVDSMRITIRDDAGERIVEGEVKERELARRMYEAAKASGSVASLLEQQRPNIFTQSVANLEPGARITVEISFVELLERKDGVYSFTFPTVVGPRYNPKPAAIPTPMLPAGLKPRAGLVLLAPAQVQLAHERPDLTAADVGRMLATAVPIQTPNPAGENPEMLGLSVTYPDGTQETGHILPRTGFGEINGRAFFVAPASWTAGIEADAGRVSPVPVPPSERAGHDLSIRVAIAAGGLPLRGLSSPMHEIVTRKEGDRTIVQLKERATIPNRDFVLNWRTDADLVSEGMLATVREPRFDGDPSAGGYFTVILNPPARVRPDAIPPREFVFVLDVSGSMSGFPIETAKAVMLKAIASMRPDDRFNVITFAGDTAMLWPEPRPATDANVGSAQAFIDGRKGGGGTEMMKAIEAALQPSGAGGWISPRQMRDLPADGRTVQVEVARERIEGDAIVEDGARIPLRLGVTWPTVPGRSGLTLRLEGRWVTKDGERVLEVDRASFAREAAANRICVFLTDGYVNNDRAIIDAVRRFAKQTRVFSFGVGSSVNRYLLEEIARQGRGTSEFVFHGSDAEATVAKFTRRIESPVLVDLEATVDGVELTDIFPPLDRLPDLYDEQPIVILGRYPKAGRGSIVLRGRTGEGPWERTVALDLPGRSGANQAVAALWARAKVNDLLKVHANSLDPEIRATIVSLGERYSIVTPFTSFVAVERGRISIDGHPMLVEVPIEMPEGVSWNGVSGKQDVDPATRWQDEGGMIFGLQSAGSSPTLNRLVVGVKRVGVGPTGTVSRTYHPLSVRDDSRVVAWGTPAGNDDETPAESRGIASPTPEPTKKSLHPELDALAKIAEHDPQQAIAKARSATLPVPVVEVAGTPMIRVTIVARPGSTRAIEEAVRAAGGRSIGVGGSLVVADLPPASLRTLAAHPELVVLAPYRAIADEANRSPRR